MNPFYQDNHDTIYCSDFRKNELPAESVQCVVTSPPYWGLRKYSGEQELIWGGDEKCVHEWGDTIEVKGHHAGETNPGKEYYTKDAEQWSNNRGSFCSLCGAWRGAYGLEPTPEMYVQHTIEILREIRRVLRKDGVVFWNIGDSYGSGKGTCFNPGGGKGSFSGHGDRKDAGAYPLDRGNVSMLKAAGLKPKDLCLIPFRVAIAAQEDGWWVRSVIIWSKPNPMPESVTDRPTESHEYLLMLTKNAGKKLYWTHRDGGGTRENPKADYRWVKTASMGRGLKTKGQQELISPEQHHGLDLSGQLVIEEVAIEPGDWKQKIKCPECEATGTVSVYLGLDVWQETKCPTCRGKKETQLWKRINLWRGHDYYWDADAVREAYSPTERWGGDTYRGAVKQGTHGEDAGLDRERSCFPGAGRNLRSVWEFPTQPYPEAHFAVFPEKLPELCIKAATPEVGCCSKCGAPWERVLSKGFTSHDGKSKTAYTNEEGHNANQLAKLRQAARASGGEYQNTKETLGWQPTCKCNADKIPSVVVDPFGGVGTVAWVAKKLNRRCYSYDTSEEYCQLAADRCRQQVLL